MKKIPLHFSERLKLARTQAKMSKTDLAKAVGVDVRRLQEYEANRRSPKAEDKQLLSRYFGFNCQVGNQKRNRCTVRALKGVGKHHFPEVSRSFRVRLSAARRKCPGLTASLESQIVSRPDFQQILGVLVKLSFDSYAELLVLMHLLAARGVLGFVSPGSQGYYGAKIVDPATGENVGGKRFPALRSSNSIWFPQVSLLAESTIRVDFLVCVQSEMGPVWKVVEVDGHGHRPDHSRESLPFRTVRFSEEDVCRYDFLDVLDSKFCDR